MKVSQIHGGNLYHYIDGTKLRDCIISGGIDSNCGPQMQRPSLWLSPSPSFKLNERPMFSYDWEWDEQTETYVSSVSKLSKAFLTNPVYRIVCNWDSKLLNWKDFLSISDVSEAWLLHRFPLLNDGRKWFCSIGFIPTSHWKKVEVLRNGRWVKSEEMHSMLEKGRGALQTNLLAFGFTLTGRHAPLRPV